MLTYLQNQVISRELLLAFGYLCPMWQALSRLPYGSYLVLWWRHLWRILLGTGLITGAVGLWLAFQPDKYLCELEFVPPVLEGLNAFPYPRVAPATPTDLERVLSYMESKTLLLQISDTFQLEKHYRLDRISDPRTRAKRLLSTLRQNIRAKITRNSTLRLQVYDEDPVYAYQIVRFALRKVQEQVDFYDRNAIVYEDAKRQEEEIDREMEAIQARLAKLRKTYKILSGPAISMEEGNVQYPFQLMLRNPESFAHYDEVVTLEMRLRKLLNQKLELRRRRMDREIFQRAGQNPIWVIEEPALPHYPARPKRLLIIALTFVGSFLGLSLLVIYASFLGLLPSRRSENPLMSVLE